MGWILESDPGERLTHDDQDSEFKSYPQEVDRAIVDQTPSDVAKQRQDRESPEPVPAQRDLADE